MPVDKPSRFAEWLAALREGVPAARIRLASWAEACREEPRLIWQTPAVRYTTYLVGGVIAVWILSATVEFMMPSPEHAAPRATTADFHVICRNPQCGHEFVINREFGFDDFPVICPRCHKETGVSARRCFSDECKGRWVVPKRQGDVKVCPRCGAVLGRTD